MNMSQLDLGIVGLYLVAMLVIGVYSGWKTNSFKDFAIGDRKVGFMALVATAFATHLGGNSTVGLSEKVFLHGIVFIFILLGFSISLLIIGTFVFGRMNDCLEE
ncbi:MAG: hypothetical protein AAF471_08890, partial [Myxococcota bacterium]